MLPVIGIKKLKLFLIHKLINFYQMIYQKVRTLGHCGHIMRQNLLSRDIDCLGFFVCYYFYD